MSIETMKLALAFVEGELTLPERDTEPSWNKEYKAQMENLIAKLRVAIEQAERAEPVACPYCRNSHTLGAVYFDQNCVGCVKRMTAPPQREWQNAALRIGEELSSVGPDGYYAMSSSEWLDWALAQNPKGKTSLQQREWQGLTENEIKHLWYEACQTNLELTSQLIVHLARNIEAKLKEKNNA